MEHTTGSKEIKFISDINSLAYLEKDLLEKFSGAWTIKEGNKWL